MPNFIKSLLISVVLSFFLVTISFLGIPIVAIFLPFRDIPAYIYNSYLYFFPILSIILWLFIHGTLYPYNPNNQNVQSSNDSDQTIVSSSDPVSDSYQDNHLSHNAGNNQVILDQNTLYSTLTTSDTVAESNPENNSPERDA